MASPENEQPVESGEVVAREFEVYVEVLPKLTEKLDKLIGRAKRLGLEPIAYELGPVEDRIYLPEDRDLPQIPYQVRKILIVGQPPKIAGYTFVGKLEHTDEGNLVTHINQDIELPARYRTAPPWCEHCGKTRKRSQSYVLHSDDGQYVQVGKSCLVDFLGRQDPGPLAEAASLVQLAIEAGEAYAQKPGRPSGPRDAYVLSDFLACVFEDIAKRGWKDKNNTKFPEETTAMAALWKMRKWMDMAEGDPSMRPAPEFYAQAQEAIGWAASIPIAEANDFQRNLGIIARTGVVTQSQAGRAAWIAHSRQAAIERGERARAREAELARKALSKHVGQPGERVARILTTDRLVELGESQFGYGSAKRYMALMHDDEGNQYVWRTTNPPALGSQAMVCTIKAHENYQGTAQTSVERCQTGPAARKAVAPSQIPSPASDALLRVMQAATDGPIMLTELPEDVATHARQLAYVPRADIGSPTDDSWLDGDAIELLQDRHVLAPAAATGRIEKARKPLELTPHGWSEAVRLGLVAQAPEPAPKPKRRRKGETEPEIPSASADEVLVRLATALYSGQDEGGKLHRATDTTGQEVGWTIKGTPSTMGVPEWYVADSTVEQMEQAGYLKRGWSDYIKEITPSGLLRAWELGVAPPVTPEELDALLELAAISPIDYSWGVTGAAPSSLLSKGLMEQFHPPEGTLFDLQGRPLTYASRPSVLGERAMQGHEQRLLSLIEKNKAQRQRMHKAAFDISRQLVKELYYGGTAAGALVKQRDAKGDVVWVSPGGVRATEAQREAMRERGLLDSLPGEHGHPRNWEWDKEIRERDGALRSTFDFEWPSERALTLAYEEGIRPPLSPEELAILRRIVERSQGRTDFSSSPPYDVPLDEVPRSLFRFRLVEPRTSDVLRRQHEQEERAYEAERWRLPRDQRATLVRPTLKQGTRATEFGDLVAQGGA